MALSNHPDLTTHIIGAAIEVHRALGPGLLESAYRRCLAHELAIRGLKVAQEVSLPLEYKGLRLDDTYRLDLLVEDKVIVEVKSVARLEAIHLAQTLTYLRLSRQEVGLLLNFNVPALKDGIRRVSL